MKKIYLTLLIFAVLACKKETVETPDGDITNQDSITNVKLKPTIGLSTVPSGADPICDFEVYESLDFESNAIPVGDTVFDFTLYNSNGVPYTLSDVLGSGKPALLVSGNYTCPAFRGNINKINAIINTYEDQIQVFVIYGLEAHPNIDISPYSGDVWITAANAAAGILYRQPETYQERLDMVTELVDSMAINCPVLVDGPCNEYWSAYGEAPNRAYLIDTDGTVEAMHGWFDYASMVVSIDHLLGD